MFVLYVINRFFVIHVEKIMAILVLYIKHHLFHLWERHINFISKNYNFSSLKKNQRNLSITLLADKNIYVRPNKGLLIPIKIINNSNMTISSSEFIILVKGNKLINITYDCSSLFKILPNTFYVLKLKCITPKIKSSENINFELYSTNFVLKENTNGKINCNIEINEDIEEEN